MTAADGAAEIERGAGARFGGSALVVLVPLALLCLWEAAGAAGLLPTGLIPTPTMVIRAWYVWTFGPDTGGFNAYSGTWTAVVANSAQRVVLGYVLAVLLAVPIGILVGWRILSRSWSIRHSSRCGLFRSRPGCRSRLPCSASRITARSF